MITDTMKVMTTLIVTITSVERDVAVGLVTSVERVAVVKVGTAVLR